MVQLAAVLIRLPLDDADSSVNRAQVFCFSISWHHGFAHAAICVSRGKVLAREG